MRRPLAYFTLNPRLPRDRCASRARWLCMGGGRGNGSSHGSRARRWREQRERGVALLSPHPLSRLCTINALDSPAHLHTASAQVSHARARTRQREGGQRGKGSVGWVRIRRHRRASRHALLALAPSLVFTDRGSRGTPYRARHPQVRHKRHRQRRRASSLVVTAVRLPCRAPFCLLPFFFSSKKHFC